MIAFLCGLLLGVALGIVAAFMLALHGLDQWP